MFEFFFTIYKFIKALAVSLKEKAFRSFFILFLIIILGGAWFYHEAEGWSYLDSLYFSVTTLATIGNSELFPHTSLGKIFTIFYVFTGVGIMFGFINVIAKHAIKQNPVHRIMNAKKEKQNKDV